MTSQNIPKTSSLTHNSHFEKPLINFSKLKVDILKAIRFPHSQKDWSKKLGYKFNQSLKWETHQKKLTWTEFCFQCEVAQINLSELLTRYFTLSLEDYSSQFIINKIISLYFNNQSIETISELLHIHSSALRRIIHGESDYDIEIILKLLHIEFQVLGEFLEDLTPNKEILFNGHKELLAFIKLNKKARHLENYLPYASAVHACINLESYKKLEKHDASYIAQKTGLTIEIIEKSLKLLVEHKVISFDQNASKYTCLQPRIDTEGLEVKDILNLASYWTARAHARINTEDGKPIRKKNTHNFLGYRVVPTSVEAQNKINDLLIQTHHTILNILESDPNPPDDIRVLVLHHFSCEDF